MRYYFHVKDGSTILDEDGAEFSSVESVKNNAIKASGEMLRSLNHGVNFWSGEPWKLWVTDGPDDTGKTILELQFIARLP
jgi:hypothetical protein